MQNGRVYTYSAPGLIGACVLIAAIALLFTTRYPPACMTWWSGSTGGATGWWCTALMTDLYPPFRLDQGSVDTEGPAQLPAASEPSQ